jgi:hypothetical protein
MPDTGLASNAPPSADVVRAVAAPTTRVPVRSNALDYLLPASILGQAPTHQEARRVAVATLALLGSNALFLVLTQLRDLPPFQALGLLAGIVYGLGVLGLLRITGRPRLAGTLLVAGFLGVLVFQSVVDLGLSNPALVPSLLAPVVAALILPRAYAVAFGGAVSALYVGLYLAHAAGWEVPFHATEEDTRVYLVLLYCATGAVLCLLACAYSRLRAEQERLAEDLARERRERSERFDAAVAAAVTEAARDARRYRSQLREVLYAARVEASQLAGEDATRDGALRLIRLANAHETALILEERVPQPYPVRPSALVRRAIADAASGVDASARVQFWVQRDGAPDGEPWPTGFSDDAGDDRLTAPEASVSVDGTLLYWSLRLVLEYAAESAPHGHVAVTLHREGEASAVSLSVHATDSAAARIYRDLDAGVVRNARLLTLPDTTVRDVRLSLARAILERGGGRLDVLSPRPGIQEDEAAGVASLSAPDELVLRLALPANPVSGGADADLPTSRPSHHLQPA